MKDRAMTLLDTYRAVIVKVTMTKKKNIMFLLNIETGVPRCLKAYVKDEIWLWHMRHGHVNFDSLKMMA
jgi:hypothetical protein